MARTAPDSAEVPIADVQTATYTVPTEGPEADGTFSWDSTTMVLVQAAAGGKTGLGWTYGPPAAAALVEDLLGPAVCGIDALDVPAAAAAMARCVRNPGRTGLASYAVSAVDCALWDLKARLLDLPLHKLLGAVRDKVAVYGSGGFTTYTETQLRDQLEGWAHGQHIPRVKIKIGQDNGTDVRRDLERIHQARAAVGPGVELFVDANGAYTAKQAVRVMRAVSGEDVSWFEEPVSSDNLPGLREVRNAVDADVAAGEYGTGLPYFLRMCAAGAVDCLQADVSRCGGISEWLRVAALAAAHGLEVSGHCAPNLSAAVAAATPNFRHLEWFHDHVRIESLFFDGTLDPDGGWLSPGAGSGNGLSLRTADADGYRVG
ncbi:enolase C-terminal domain-like protein [Pseudarthrobacter niigatensis]|uniref:L-alanine-DL-glutamate epimerase-like enolase superfamily enzyme n=1 Tax=Pseudarthrobacter niigatensis TaxID=369935 RepID=A0AAJ1SPQ1_9MICC|nr:enolase C-terminal domain-like protein [Pseudarthrobacter niigatensis]MDQ0144579.1 L-alanine-DL-glutamate epimerase-like enolase superfamily enzyme [Pseudarthrobacter niigatensis]MDQ0265225.1 L-alanine-DL-glutamate epimerase-like enolase superfamily enzyme [Pseudarthrobacter niigatensis]